jgi:hypothetical protein
MKPLITENWVTTLDFEFLLYTVNTYSKLETTMSERKQYTTVPDNITKFFTENYFQLQGAIKCLNPCTSQR